MQLNDYIDLVNNTMLPFQWEALNDRIADAEPSHVIENFINADKRTGKQQGTMWQDSDLAKWLEAVGYSLGRRWDEALFQKAEAAIALVIAAQGEDGYINTYISLNNPQYRWRNVEQCHELYCAGHFIQAAIAYHKGTGRRALLDGMLRFADEIDRIFGPEEGKIHGYPGHEEIELALCDLYQHTGEVRYLNLAKYFVDTRGTKPSFLEQQRRDRGYTNLWQGSLMPMEYFQAHIPVREQTVATGHAVRAVYLYTAMAKLSYLTQDASLQNACHALWNDITHKQMYITGAIGASVHGEAFTTDYHLPNDRAYAETCASVGLIFFAADMIRLDPENTVYGDVMERALYNCILASFGLEGRSFFYTNPLQVDVSVCGKPDGQGDPALKHVNPTRRKWMGCACCPPNVARLLTNIQTYATSLDDRGDTLRCHLLLPGEQTHLGDFGSVTFDTRTDYPWDGRITIKIIKADLTRPLRFALRIPAWAEGKVEDIAVPVGCVNHFERSFFVVQRRFVAGDEISLRFPMQVRLVRAHPAVRVDAGCVAIERGPLVYCVEQIDHALPLHSLLLEDGMPPEPKPEDDFRGTVTLVGEGYAQYAPPNDELYHYEAPTLQKAHIRAIPYFQFANRGATDMQIWLWEKL